MSRVQFKPIDTSIGSIERLLYPNRDPKFHDQTQRYTLGMEYALWVTVTVPTGSEKPLNDILDLIQAKVNPNDFNFPGTTQSKLFNPRAKILSNTKGRIMLRRVVKVQHVGTLRTAIQELRKLTNRRIEITNTFVDRTLELESTKLSALLTSSGGRIVFEDNSFLRLINRRPLTEQEQREQPREPTTAPIEKKPLQPPRVVPTPEEERLILERRRKQQTQAEQPKPSPTKKRRGLLSTLGAIKDGFVGLVNKLFK